MESPSAHIHQPRRVSWLDRALAPLTGRTAVNDTGRRLEGIVLSAIDGIITINEKQDVVVFNPAAEQMFGVSAAEALGKPISQFIPERFRNGHERHIQAFHKTGVTNRRMGSLGAISGRRANGEEFPIEASISQADVGGERLSTVILRDISERVANEHARTLLAREVDHRAKNVLAVAQALVRLTRADDQETFKATVLGRISALARAHSLLSQSRWKGAALERVIGDELAAYARPAQVRLAGPGMVLASAAVQPVGLLVHELATNACKHGALRLESGEIEVEWTGLPDGSLHLHWRERGGPPVTQPACNGFGQTLLKEVVTRQLGGLISSSWLPQGLEVSIVLPKGAFHRDGSGEIQRLHAAREGAPTRGNAERGAILVVEDEVLIGMELASELTDAGWEVVGPANTLDQAIRLANDTPKLQAALLDVNLHGHTVYPLAEALKGRGVPMIFCTGYELLEKHTDYAESAVLRKPVTAESLRFELGRILAA